MLGLPEQLHTVLGKTTNGMLAVVRSKTDCEQSLHGAKLCRYLVSGRDRGGNRICV